MPKCILLFSGKRKSGKDFLTDCLKEKYNGVAIIKISAPIKEHFATVYGLRIEDLMSSDSFKENYRLEMIDWSEKLRNEDDGVFCRQAVKKFADEDTPVWIVSDLRRKSDVAWFRSTYGGKIKLVRVTADVKIRENRGWKFTSGVDDAPSECDLDDFCDWDWIIDNNADDCPWEEKMSSVIDYLDKIINKE